MTDTIRLILHGQKAEAGQTIWEAANGQGLVIPHLCHKPEKGYRPDGSCRACMVEGEIEGVLVASCICPVAEGIDVSTDRARATARGRASRARW